MHAIQENVILISLKNNFLFVNGFTIPSRVFNWNLSNTLLSHSEVSSFVFERPSATRLFLILDNNLIFVHNTKIANLRIRCCSAYHEEISQQQKTSKTTVSRYKQWSIQKDSCHLQAQLSVA